MARGSFSRRRRNARGSTRVSAQISSMKDSTAKTFPILPGARRDEGRSGVVASHFMSVRTFAKR